MQDIKFEKMINNVLNIDCFEGFDYIPDKSIDCIICDLPYGQTARNKWDTVLPLNDYVIFDKKIYGKKDFFYKMFLLNKSLIETTFYWEKNKINGLWSHYNRIIKDNGAIILFGNGLFTVDLMQSNRKLWKYNLIWEKTQPTGFFNSNRMPLRNHEDICVFYKKQCTYNPQKTYGHIRKVSKAEHKKNCKKSTNYGEYDFSTYDSDERFPKSIWKFQKDTQKSSLHPTQKPLKLIECLVKTYTDENMIILDNCCGSGTTGIACMNTNRKFIMFEKSFDYYTMTLNRIELNKSTTRD